MTFTVYFDASGAPDQGLAMSVAGFIATDEQWVMYEKDWRAALGAYGVSELHMKDFGPGAGEFAAWKECKHRRRNFLERLISIIKTRVRHSFVSSIMLEHFRKVDEKYALSDVNRPLALAGVTAIHKVKMWAERWKINQAQIAYVFEDGDKDKGNLIARCEVDHRFTPRFMKKSETCAFQAADLLAYEHRLANQKIFQLGPGILAMSDLRGSMQALSEIPHGNDGESWGIYAEQELETHCAMNNYPLRNAAEKRGDGRDVF